MGNGNTFTGFRSHGLLFPHPDSVQTAGHVCFLAKALLRMLLGWFETLTLGFLEGLNGKAYFGTCVTEMEMWDSRGENQGNETLKERKAELCC